MLLGENIRLRGLEFEELKLLYDWMNDIELLNDILRIKPSTLHFTKQWYEKIYTDNSKIILAIEENTQKNLIGCIGVNNVNNIERKAELYIYIGSKAYTGKGFGVEATQIFLKYLFNYYNIHKVYLNVREDNEKAINMYKKVGFVKEGLLIDDRYAEGKYINMVRMYILNGDL